MIRTLLVLWLLLQPLWAMADLKVTFTYTGLRNDDTSITEPGELSKIYIYCSDTKNGTYLVEATITNPVTNSYTLTTRSWGYCYVVIEDDWGLTSSASAIGTRIPSLSIIGEEYE